MEVEEVHLDDKAKRMRDLLSSFYATDPSQSSPSKHASLDAINTASFDPDQYMDLLVIFHRKFQFSYLYVYASILCLWIFGFRFRCCWYHLELNRESFESEIDEFCSESQKCMDCFVISRAGSWEGFIDRTLNWVTALYRRKCMISVSLCLELSLEKLYIFIMVWRVYDQCL